MTNETGTLVFHDTQGKPQTAAWFYRAVPRQATEGDWYQAPVS
jgi:hypothetical protein